MKKVIMFFIFVSGTCQLAAQYNVYHYLNGDNKNIERQIYLNHSPALNVFQESTEVMKQSTIWEEIGYIAAMETFFLGMGALASRKKGYGPKVAGGFDVFMGAAGIGNLFAQDSNVHAAGYLLLTTGFLAKALFNFKYFQNHQPKTIFWTNFIGYNV
ncbi:MAG: hypothetical protein DWQ10_18345, partial [Calditrichaeota bacterium]